MQVEDNFSIQSFVEKPKKKEVIEEYLMSEKLLKSVGRPKKQKACLASMGIYLFNADVLMDALDSEDTDFGKEVIPGLLGKKSLKSYIFDGYWEDIGTVSAFFEANLKLTDDQPPFDFFDPYDRIFTRPRYLSASVIINSRIDRAIVADGCTIKNAKIERSVIGVRSQIGKKASLSNVVYMGSDVYESDADKKDLKKRGIPPLGVGSNCTIRNAILDKNVRIGDNVTLDPEGKVDGTYPGGITVRDGILIVAKDQAVPEGTTF